MAVNERTPKPELVYAVCEDGLHFLLNLALEAIPTHVNTARVVAIKPGPDLSGLDEQDQKVKAAQLLEEARKPQAPAAAVSNSYGGDQ